MPIEAKFRPYGPAVAQYSAGAISEKAELIVGIIRVT